MSIVFGPVPSRRLGRSLGINNIPPKHCNYSCIYCQIGYTDSMSVKRREFYAPEKIFREAYEKIIALENAGEKIDYITFVPDGEPTLDINLGKTIDKLKSFALKIAVITNSSLMWDPGVREDLMKANWVSVKIDTAYENIWHKINRPHGALEYHKIIEGIKQFSLRFKGTLVTETMLVKGINDSVESLNKTAQLIKNIEPFKSYILVPTRPPAEKSVKKPTEESLNAAYQIFSSLINNIELLAYNEGAYFTYLSDAEKELLSILSVHPMRKDAVEVFLSRANSSWDFIDNLIKKKMIKNVEYNNDIFFLKTD